MKLPHFFKRRIPPENCTHASPPETYAEWSCWFDAFEKGDDDDILLSLAQKGRITWSHGMAYNFTLRANQTFQKRLEIIRKMLQKNLNNSHDEHATRLALLNARHAFSQLSRYAHLSCWPDPIPKQLHDMLTQSTAALHKNLLQSATQDRTGKLVKILKDTPINRNISTSSLPTERETSPLTSPSKKRSILL